MAALSSGRSPERASAPVKPSKPETASQKSGHSQKRTGSAKFSGGSPIRDTSPKRVSGPAKSAAATKDAASATLPRSGGSRKPSGSSAKRDAGSTRQAPTENASPSKQTGGSAKRGGSPNRDAAGAITKSRATPECADSSKRGVSVGKGAQAKTKAAQDTQERASATKAAIGRPQAATGAPSSTQPDAGTVPETMSSGGDSGIPGSASKRGSVGRSVRELTNKLMLPFITSRSYPDTERKLGLSSSPETQPKLAEPSSTQWQQAEPSAAPEGPVKGKRFRRWLQERIRRARSAQGIPYKDESTSSVTFGRMLLRATAIAVAIVIVSVLMLTITWRILSGPRAGRVIEHALLDSSVNDSESRSGHSRVDTGKCADPYEALFRDSVDTGASPCTNFYQYACGAWIRNHQLSSAATNWVKLAKTAIQRIREKQNATERDEPVRRAALYLETCLSGSGRGINSDGVAIDDVKAVLAEGGLTWPNRSEHSDFVSALFFMARRVALPVFFGIDVGYSEGGRRVLLFPLDVPFQRILRRFRQHMKTGRAREDIRVAYETFAEDTFDAERCAMVLSTLHALTGVLEVYVNAADREQQDDVTSLEVHAPAVTTEKWSTLLRRYHKAYFSDIEAVVIYDVTSFSAIFKALQNKGEETMNDALGFLSVLATVHYTNTTIRDTFFGSADEAANHQEQYCFVRAYLFYEHVLNYILLDSSAKSLEEFRRLVENVRSSFLRLILTNETIPDGGILPSSEGYNIRSIFERVEKSRPEFFVSYYARYPSLTDSALHNWIVLADHVRKAGVLSLREPAEHGNDHGWAGHCGTAFYKWRLTPCHLSFPWYLANGHRGVILAGLGARIAAALFLDYVDRNVTSRMEVYKRNDDCLRTSTALPDTSIDLGLQASVAAIRAAWRMYEFEKASNAFPDVGPVTSSRVFFLFGCHLFCGESAGPRMCNVPLRHSTDFARVFACRQESEMNPRKKCAMQV